MSDWVFPTTQGVRVYVNESDEISICQESAYQESDVVVSIPVQHIPALCKALKAAAAEARNG